MESQISLDKCKARENRPFLWQIEQIDRDFATETTRQERINNFLITDEQLEHIEKLIPEINFKRIKIEGRDNRPYLWKISEINRENSLENARQQWENEINLDNDQNIKLKKTLEELSQK